MTVTCIGILCGLAHCSSDGVVLSIEDEDLTPSGPTPHLETENNRPLCRLWGYAYCVQFLGHVLYSLIKGVH